MPPAIVSCGLCGTEFVKPAYEVLKHQRRGLDQMFCSLKCTGTAANNKVHGIRTCRRCGAHAPRESAFGTQANPLCSKACLQAERAEKKAVRMASRPWKVCPECEGRFQFNPAQERFRAKRGLAPVTYCGKECADRAHARRMSGQTNPAYRHGMHPARLQPHAAKAFREVRTLVLERDRSACAVCSSERNVHVHHIDHNPLNNRWRNLVCLCSKCHRGLHADEKSHTPSRRTRFLRWTSNLSEIAALRSTIFRSKAITTFSQMEF